MQTRFDNEAILNQAINFSWHAGAACVDCRSEEALFQNRVEEYLIIVYSESLTRIERSLNRTN